MLKHCYTIHFNKLAVPTTYQTRVPQVTNLPLPDSSADEVIGAKMDIVLAVIADGVLDAPQIVDGTTYL